jgi:hypothetical protein
MAEQEGRMRDARAVFLAFGVVLLTSPLRGVAPQKPPTPASEIPPAADQRDGRHDFDPLLGAWKYHLKRLQRPLSGSHDWVEFEGTGTCVKVWDGRAQFDQVELDSPTGHIEGLTLRTYNPTSHQWSLFWANSKDGVVDPPQVGEFKNGRGEFLAQIIKDGRSILCRYVWTNMNTTPHFEQSFSEDGGKTWEVNWITDQTKVGAP